MPGIVLPVAVVVRHHHRLVGFLLGNDDGPGLLEFLPGVAHKVDIFLHALFPEAGELLAGRPPEGLEVVFHVLGIGHLGQYAKNMNRQFLVCC